MKNRQGETGWQSNILHCQIRSLWWWLRGLPIRRKKRRWNRSVYLLLFLCVGHRPTETRKNDIPTARKEAGFDVLPVGWYKRRYNANHA